MSLNGEKLTVLLLDAIWTEMVSVCYRTKSNLHDYKQLQAKTV